MPLSQLQNHHGPLLRIRLRFLSYFKGALLLNFRKTVKQDLLIMEVKQLKDIFSIAGINLLPLAKHIEYGGRQHKSVRKT
jgi:hypothetical protein